MPPRQYIEDRCNGTSYPDQDVAKPPCFVCYVPPCVKPFVPLIEQNCLCYGLGGLGCVDGSEATSLRLRRILFSIGLISNIIGLGLSIVATFAISSDFDVLQSIGWSSGTANGVNVSIPEVTLDLGLRAIAFDNPNTVGEIVVGFNELCDAVGSGAERYVSDEQCGDCEDASAPFQGSMIITCLFYWPSIFSDFTRLYPAYDVNCQKAFGVVAGAISLALTIFSMAGYFNTCFDAFFQGDILFFSNFTPVPPDYDGDEPLQVINFSWRAGNGFICLVVATILKFVDLTMHLIVPTPSIARNLEEQQAYEEKYGQQQQQGKIDDEE